MVKSKNSRKAVKRNADDALSQTSFAALSGVESIEPEYADDIEPEDLPRRFKVDEPEGLPIIVDGKVRQVKRPKIEKKENESDDENENESEEDTAKVDEEEEPELQGAELKEYIALFADIITSEPESNLGKLKDMVERITKSKKTKNRQLLIVSLLPVFKSIIPGYRIKELTDAQQSEKTSKDTKQLRDYEQGLLKYYGKYVSILHSCIRAGKSSIDVSKNRYILGCTCVEVACDLLESVPHFNYRQELIVSVIDKLSSQKIDASYTRCLNCLTTIFQLDNEGHVSFETLQALSKMIKQRRYKVDSRVLNVLTSLRLLTELQGRADLERMIKEKPQSFAAQHKLKKKDRIHLTKTQRKARKEQKEIDEEMRKADLGVSSQVKERLQAQTLKLVFVLYMNILKFRVKNLLSPTLEGLAMYTHLINANLFNDLLEVLREILTLDGDTTDSRQRLLCVYTAFQLLKGQGTNWEQSTDLGFFVEELYKSLGTMCLNPLIEQSHKSLQSSHAGRLTSETDMMVRCLEMLFLKHRGVSKMRLLAFTKRLAECSLQFPERSSLVALKVLHQMVREHPEARALLTVEDRVGRGNYNPEALVPEQANAEVSTIWEVALLREHYDPRVRESARAVFRK